MCVFTVLRHRWKPVVGCVRLEQFSCGRGWQVWQRLKWIFPQQIPARPEASGGERKRRQTVSPVPVCTLWNTIFIHLFSLKHNSLSTVPPNAILFSVWTHPVSRTHLCNDALDSQPDKQTCLCNPVASGRTQGHPPVKFGSQIGFPLRDVFEKYFQMNLFEVFLYLVWMIFQRAGWHVIVEN